MNYTGDMNALSEKEYRYLCEFIFAKTGIYYANHKRLMVESRLSSLVGTNQPFDSFSHLVWQLQHEPTPDLVSWVIGRLSTHYSYFFREPVHFRFLQYKLMGDWATSMNVRVLSAACAAGQEAWSAAICAQSALHQGRKGQISIQGLDVDRASVALAQAGCYPGSEILPNMTSTAVNRYFDQTSPDSFQVKEILRQHCTFRIKNLLDPIRNSNELYDIVFLRNILIYFKPDERKHLLTNMRQLIRPQGYLIISLSESLQDHSLPFKSLKYSIYRPR